MDAHGEGDAMGVHICMCGCVKRSTEIIYTMARADISHPRSLCFSAVYEIISPGDTLPPRLFVLSHTHNSGAKLNPIKCVKILH
jgi:hypothetical protein